MSEICRDSCSWQVHRKKMNPILASFCSWREKGIIEVSKIWVDSGNRMLDELIVSKNNTLTIVSAVTKITARSMLFKWKHAKMSSAHVTMNYAERAAEIVISMNDSNYILCSLSLFLSQVFAVIFFFEMCSKNLQVTLLHLVVTCSYLNCESLLWAINLWALQVFKYMPLKPTVASCLAIYMPHTALH